MKEEFAKWMIEKEGKAETTAYQYSGSINKISKHYSKNTEKSIDLYKIEDSELIKKIADEYNQKGRFFSFGNEGHATNRNAIATYVRFLDDKYKNKTTQLKQNHESNDTFQEIGIIEDQVGVTNFTYERDLKGALISQTEKLFPGYKIFGLNQEGIEFIIEGKRIDLLLENMSENSLLAIEIKAGLADYRVFGQVSMYLGLLTKKFPQKIIQGLIISGEVDESLINACSITDKVRIKTYKMELSLEEIE